MKANVRFHFVDVKDTIQHKRKLYSCLKEILKQYRNKTVSAEINYIFCSDSYLLDINRKFLNHDDYTDIITFDLSEEASHLHSEIYISLERVEDNAILNKVSITNELYRVLSHGLLHLSGYNDKSAKDSQNMRRLEQECIARIEQSINK